MTFEFLIACRMTPRTDMGQVLTELLVRILEDNQNDFDEGTVADMVQLRHERSGKILDDNDMTSCHTLIGLAIELPDEIDFKADVIDAFAKSLPETPPVFHAVKFEDPLLQAELAQHAAEIFALEMKLRRVLSLIYLHAYLGADPFDILRDEATQPATGGERLTQNQMQAANENQFFHLTFSQYTNLNHRPPFRPVDILKGTSKNASWMVKDDRIGHSHRFGGKMNSAFRGISPLGNGDSTVKEDIRLHPSHTTYAQPTIPRRCNPTRRRML